MKIFMKAVHLLSRIFGYKVSDSHSNNNEKNEKKNNKGKQAEFKGAVQLPMNTAQTQQDQKVEQSIAGMPYKQNGKMRRVTDPKRNFKITKQAEFQQQMRKPIFDFQAIYRKQYKALSTILIQTSKRLNSSIKQIQNDFVVEKNPNQLSKMTNFQQIKQARGILRQYNKQGTQIHKNNSFESNYLLGQNQIEQKYFKRRGFKHQNDKIKSTKNIQKNIKIQGKHKKLQTTQNIKIEQFDLSKKKQDQPSRFSSVNSQPQSQQDSQIIIQDQRNAHFQQNIQRKLDQIVEFSIQTDGEQISALEDLLYSFKEKHKIMNDKMEIKWRILMAHCKEKRCMFERACILYQQILSIANDKPWALIICKGDVYHKLGIYYTEDQKWNKGIKCFRKCLRIFKQKCLVEKYADSMNNLGRLYLLAGNYADAYIFLVEAYSTKAKHFGTFSSHLLSTLGNLFQCNLKGRNFIEADKNLISMSIIAKNQNNSSYIEAGVLRKRAKMFFVSGQLNLIENLLIRSQGLLSSISQETYTYSIEYAQIANCRGLLRIEQKRYEQAKVQLEIAFFVFQGYYSRSSIVLKTLKRNIQMVENFLIAEKGVQLILNDPSVPKVSFAPQIQQILDRKYQLLSIRERRQCSQQTIQFNERINKVYDYDQNN